jgi:hypothetical protein
MSRMKPLTRATADEVLAGVDLYRKRMVVTGCHSDIGFETMKSLAANGAHVIGLARSLEEARAACAAAGRSCTPISCDLTDLRSINAAVSLIRGDSAPLDAVITNLEGDSQPATHALFEHVGAFALLNRLCDSLRRNGGRIVMAATAGADARYTAGKREMLAVDPTRFSRAFDPSALYVQSIVAIRLFVARSRSTNMESAPLVFAETAIHQVSCARGSDGGTARREPAACAHIGRILERGGGGRARFPSGRGKPCETPLGGIREDDCRAR